MFYYKIALTTKKGTFGGVPTTETTYAHREFLRPRHLGEYVASLAAERPVKIVVEPISQADYVHETRSD